MAERIPTEEVERLLAEATPGPWTTASDRPRCIDTGHTVQIDEADWGQPEEGQHGADRYSVGLLADNRAWRYGDVRLLAAAPDLAADLLDARRALAEMERRNAQNHLEATEAHAENERLREALEAIASEDFRGPQPRSVSIARAALSGEEP